MITFKELPAKILNLGLVELKTRIFQCEHGGEKFQIIASRNGITLLGPSPQVSDEEDLNSFAEAVARAWQAHKALKLASME